MLQPKSVLHQDTSVKVTIETPRVYASYNVELSISWSHVDDGFRHVTDLHLIFRSFSLGRWPHLGGTMALACYSNMITFILDQISVSRG